MSTITYPIEIRCQLGTLLASWDMQWGFRQYKGGEFGAYLIGLLGHRNSEDFPIERAANILSRVAADHHHWEKLGKLPLIPFHDHSNGCTC